MSELELATEVMNGAWRTASEAQRNAYSAEAEVVRLLFLDYASEHPTKIKGFSFESEYQYNDEGGYFISTSVYPCTTECTADIIDDYELTDILGGHSREALALVCGVDEDSFAGECTLQQARDLRF